MCLVSCVLLTYVIFTILLEADAQFRAQQQEIYMKKSLLALSIATMVVSSPFAIADGAATYNTACVGCHMTGAAGAPKMDDKDAWAPRIAQGSDVLYASALEGKGVMPAKGGQMQLSDDEIKAAVDYMVEQAK